MNKHLLRVATLTLTWGNLSLRPAYRPVPLCGRIVRIDKHFVHDRA